MRVGAVVAAASAATSGRSDSKAGSAKHAPRPRRKVRRLKLAARSAAERCSARSKRWATAWVMNSAYKSVRFEQAARAPPDFSMWKHNLGAVDYLDHRD